MTRGERRKAEQQTQEEFNASSVSSHGAEGKTNLMSKNDAFQTDVLEMMEDHMEASEGESDEGSSVPVEHGHVNENNVTEQLPDNSSDDETCSRSALEALLIRPSRIKRWRRVGVKTRMLRRGKPPQVVAGELHYRLGIVSENLLTELIEYLSSESTNEECFSLPASAASWLSLQLNALMTSEDRDSDDRNQMDYLTAPGLSKQRLQRVATLLSRLKKLRINSETWPPRKKMTIPENSLGDLTDDQATEFLRFYDSLLFRPRIDLSVFSRVESVLIYGVPTSWLFNLHSIRDSLEELVVEKGCINDLSHFLLPEDRQDEYPGDPLSSPLAGIHDYSRLKYLRLNDCCLNRKANMRSKVQQDGRRTIAPMAKLGGKLEVIDLSHNEIISSRDALAGLRNLSRLSSLNLSNNWIHTMENAHYRLGNIQCLRLSHNKLRDVCGIDHLLSLKELYLDHNEIPEISSIRGLARLQLLDTLHLRGNPLEIQELLSYRVNILAVFVEKRMSGLDANATFGKLQALLPSLDGVQPTLRELKHLKRKVAFRPVSCRADEVLTENLDTRQSDQEMDNTNDNIPESVQLVYQSVRNPINQRRVRKIRLTNVALPVAKVTEDISSRSQHAAFSTVDVIESIRARRNKDVRAAKEEDSGREMSSSYESMLDDISIGKDIYGSYLRLAEQKAITSPQVATPQSISADTSVVSGDQPSCEVDEALVGGDEDAENSLVGSLATNSRDDDIENTLDEKPGTTMTRSEDGEATQQPLQPRIPTVYYDNVDMDYDLDAELGGELFESKKPATSTLLSSSREISPIKSMDEAKRSSVESVVTSTTVAESNGDERGGTTTPPRPETPVGSETVLSDIDTSDNTIASGATPSRYGASWMRVVSENTWQDESSVLGSGSPSKPEALASKKYLAAEQNAVFEGSDVHRSLLISENLDFYFRMFVFPETVGQGQSLESSFPGAKEERHDWSSVLERYPRIQLWSVDRKQQENDYAIQTMSKEAFHSVRTENVVACGRPALRRLTPTRNSRYGFHGECLWSASETDHLIPETVTESRKVVLCMSSEAMYLIAEHDKVSQRSLERKRVFPVPIPANATFESARFPHAFARHTWGNLFAITIGFGFQRLTLRFESPTSTDEYTYIVLTSSKIETVKLLKDIQQLAEQAREQVAGLTISSDTPAIENDDRFVLDAVTASLAPDPVGMILHFQIVLQRWKHGDRGCVRRVCMITDTRLYLLDENYTGDGSLSTEAGRGSLGDPIYGLVDSADISLLERIDATVTEREAVTIVVRPNSRLQRMRNWRLVCRDAECAEKLVEDLRKAYQLLQQN